MAHFYKATSIYPDEGISNRQIGYYEQSQGNLKGAIYHYQHALNDYNVPDVDRAQIWRNMAVAYRDLGDLDKARECLQTSTTFQSK